VIISRDSRLMGRLWAPTKSLVHPPVTTWQSTMILPEEAAQQAPQKRDGESWVALAWIGLALAPWAALVALTSWYQWGG
jgi:hypothetical protein